MVQNLLYLGFSNGLLTKQLGEWKLLCPVPQSSSHPHQKKKHSELVGCWILHQDSALLHVVHLLLEYLKKHNNIRTMTHPPQSADLSPCNFWLFPALEHGLCGWQFANDAEVMKVSSSGVDISISYRYYRYALAYRNIDMNCRYHDIFDISLITVITA